MRIRAIFTAIMIGTVVCLTSSGASAQDAISASSPASTKQAQKQAQKQARKQARAKNKAEIKQLQKNGFDPADGEAGYPQNIQRAERRSQASGAGAASAPAK
ncbi:DUF4148 domain-containing protein [Paraburkholderia tuberum]|uniref:DUF4148 domain-containing protein n=1 Tax=Paraburkholderia tuberum TaxID=157910 RepID=A0A1H1KF22_9BURK|nr:DUF4148 domain-containing protein [Paraburkholderia tuberum]SDR60883.1 protein of unknown function [Paraburkholderia tuberum]